MDEQWNMYQTDNNLDNSDDSYNDNDRQNMILEIMDIENNDYE